MVLSVSSSGGMTARACQSGARPRCVCAGERACPRACSRESKAIFYEIESSTWFGRQSLKSHEGPFFALYTFCRPNLSRYAFPMRLSRPLWERVSPGYLLRNPCGNLGSQACKVEPLLYTCFTAIVARMKAMMRSTIGAVIWRSVRRRTRHPASAASRYFSVSAVKPEARL